MGIGPFHSVSGEPIRSITTARVAKKYPTRVFANTAASATAPTSSSAAMRSCRSADPAGGDAVNYGFVTVIVPLPPVGEVN